MENVLIYDVTRNNYKRVLEVLEEQGARWLSGGKPTENPTFDEVYTVGRWRKNELTYGDIPFSSGTRMSAEEFLRKYRGGKITITSKGRKVTATDQDGNRASARCCPEDNFDFYEGAKLALERLEDKTREIKEGDKVRIINTGKSFTTLPVAYFTTEEELRRYAFGVTPRDGQLLEVERVGHDGKLYVSPLYCEGPTSQLYVIGPEGVERVTK